MKTITKRQHADGFVKRRIRIQRIAGNGDPINNQWLYHALLVPFNFIVVLHRITILSNSAGAIPGSLTYSVYPVGAMFGNIPRTLNDVESLSHQFCKHNPHLTPTRCVPLETAISIMHGIAEDWEMGGQEPEE